MSAQRHIEALRVRAMVIAMPRRAPPDKARLAQLAQLAKAVDAPMPTHDRLLVDAALELHRTIAGDAAMALLRAVLDYLDAEDQRPVPGDANDPDKLCPWYKQGQFA